MYYVRLVFKNENMQEYAVINSDYIQKENIMIYQVYDEKQENIINKIIKLDDVKLIEIYDEIGCIKLIEL